MFILENYFASKLFATVREVFSKAHPDEQVPNKAIIRLVTQFRSTGSVCDRKHVRRRAVLTGETLRNVEETLARSPQKSFGRLSQKIGLSVISAHRATEPLKWWPYRLQAVHQLEQRDTAARIQCCRWFRRFVREAVHVLDNFFSPMKCCSNWVEIYTVKTADCESLKTRTQCTKLLCIHWGLARGVQCLEGELRDHCFLSR
jgi:hypothetical protein